MEIITHSAAETKKFGREIAAKLKGGEILALTGNLGSGKTTFVQGLAEGLGITSRIISPTFILMRKYDLSINNKQSAISNFYHVDLYRFEDNIQSEVRNLGLTDIWGKLGNVVIIEWAKKIAGMVPKSATWIKFENIGEDKRKITV